jgi:hypothetical protein
MARSNQGKYVEVSLYLILRVYNSAEGYSCCPESTRREHWENSSSSTLIDTRIAPPGIEPMAPVLEVSEGLQTTFGITNVLVYSNPATLTRPQLEPSIASNPTNPVQLATGFADFQNDPINFDAAPGVSRSTDSGKTWFAPSGGPDLPNPPGFTWGNRSLPTYLASGDSAVAWGLGKVVHYSTIGFHDQLNPPNGDCAAGGLYVYRSNDGRNNWTLPAKGQIRNKNRYTLVSERNSERMPSARKNLCSFTLPGKISNRESIKSQVLCDKFYFLFLKI